MTAKIKIEYVKKEGWRYIKIYTKNYNLTSDYLPATAWMEITRDSDGVKMALEKKEDTSFGYSGLSSAKRSSAPDYYWPKADMMFEQGGTAYTLKDNPMTNTDYTMKFFWRGEGGDIISDVLNVKFHTGQVSSITIEPDGSVGGYGGIGLTVKSVTLQPPVSSEPAQQVAITDSGRAIKDSPLAPAAEETPKLEQDAPPDPPASAAPTEKESAGMLHQIGERVFGQQAMTEQQAVNMITVAKWGGVAAVVIAVGAGIVAAIDFFSKKKGSKTKEEKKSEH